MIDHIQVENQIDKVVMPDNLKVGLMVAEQRKKCASGGCTGEYYGLGFGQSPFHVAVVTGDAYMLEPNHYGARITFVDCDGKKPFDDYNGNIPKTSSDELEFARKNAPLMLRSTDSLREWVKHIKSE